MCVTCITFSCRALLFAIAATWLRLLLSLCRSVRLRDFNHARCERTAFQFKTSHLSNNKQQAFSFVSLLAARLSFLPFRMHSTRKCWLRFKWIDGIFVLKIEMSRRWNCFERDKPQTNTRQRHTRGRKGNRENMWTTTKEKKN